MIKERTAGHGDLEDVVFGCVRTPAQTPLGFAGRLLN